MNMTPHFRKFALTAHITFSIGWLGAVVAYLVLALTGLTSRDAQMARAAYLSMEVIGWFVIVPFSLAALSSGLVQSLGTQAGLFRHYWILVKFVLTTGATVVLLRHMEAVSGMSRVAAAMTLSGADFRVLRIQLVVHAVGGLLVLLAATTLSVYKPWGLTPYGRCKAPRTKLSSRPDSTGDIKVAVMQEATTHAPRWVSVVGYHAIGLVVLVVVLHLAGGGTRGH